MVLITKSILFTWDKHPSKIISLSKPDAHELVHTTQPRQIKYLYHGIVPPIDQMVKKQKQSFYAVVFLYL